MNYSKNQLNSMFVDKSVDKSVINFYYLYVMNTKMYSFRLDKKLMDNAKKFASKMDMSMSSFIRYLLKEKFEKGSNFIINYREDKIEALREISSEIKKLRSDIKKLSGNKD